MRMANRGGNMVVMRQQSSRRMIEQHHEAHLHDDELFDPDDPDQNKPLSPAAKHVAHRAVRKIKKFLNSRRENHPEGFEDFARIARRRKASERKLKEICVYTVFLIFFNISSVYQIQDQNIYFFGHNILEQFTTTEFRAADSYVKKTFQDVATVQEFHQWMRGPMFDAIYTASSTDGRSENDYPGMIFGRSHLIGGVRISQLRSKATSCTRAPRFQFLDTDKGFACYGDVEGEFTLDTEDKQPFGDGAEQFTWHGWNRSSLSVKDARDRPFSDIRTRFGTTYDAPAFYIVLPHEDNNLAMSTLNYLDQNSYIDPQTRFVLVEVIYYNPMVDYFTNARFMAENTKGGGLVVSSDYTVTRLYTMFESRTNISRVIEFVVIFFYAYFTVSEVHKGWKFGLQYYLNLGVFLHNFNIILYMLVWAFRVVAYVNSPKEDEVVADSNTFYDFRWAFMYRSISVYLNSMNAFLCWFKLVRYLSYIPTFGLVTGTLYRSARGIGGFAVIFCVVFYGFSAAHLITFGTKVHAFRNLTASTFTLLKSLLGDFDFDDLEAAQWFMGPLFFFLFIGVAVFVVLNVLIAIISDSYSDQQAHMQTLDQSVGEDMLQYVKSLVYKVPFAKGLMKRAAKKAAEVQRKADMARKLAEGRESVVVPAELLTKPDAEESNAAKFKGARRQSSAAKYAPDRPRTSGNSSAPSMALSSRVTPAEIEAESQDGMPPSRSHSVPVAFVEVENGSHADDELPRSLSMSLPNSVETRDGSD